MYWLWTEYGLKKGVAPKRASGPPGSKPLVNILGPIYGYFNTYSTSPRSAAGRGDRRRGELVFPLGSHLADVPRLSTPT
jgi:chlorophyllide a reductase subunit Z